MSRVPTPPPDVPEEPPRDDEAALPVARPRVAAGTRHDVSEQAKAAVQAGGIEDEIASLVHDVKGPLSIIALEAKLLEERLATRSSGAVQRGLQRIGQNAWYVDRIISDLLDLGSMQNGKLELVVEKTDLARLLARSLERAVSTLDRERVELEIHEHPIVLADAMRIERVVSNLLGNALKYTPFRSKVTIRLGARADHARVAISDRGPGLTEDDARGVFDRYRRASSSRGRAGYGLGLYVSRCIVEAHGGTIGVTSAPGHGACFWFELPVESSR